MGRRQVATRYRGESLNIVDSGVLSYLARRAQSFIYRDFPLYSPRGLLSSVTLVPDKLTYWIIVLKRNG